MTISKSLSHLLTILCFSIVASLSAYAQDAPQTPPPPSLPDTTELATPEAVTEPEQPEKNAAPKPEEEASIDAAINNFMAPISKWSFKFIFAGVELEDSEGEVILDKDGNHMELPLILIWLVGAALLFTVIFRFINVRLLKLAFKTVKGKYSKDDDPGEITHFQALSAALSGTVGLGNIAGVAIAVSVGGAGAIFWMVVVGVLGMTTKFCECTLGVKYRNFDKDGKVHGGAMYYLRDGLKERDMTGMGKVLAVLFAIMCVGASFGGGNMFQINQAATQFIGITESAEHTAAKTELATIQKQKAEFTNINANLTGISSELESTSSKVDKIHESHKESYAYNDLFKDISDKTGSLTVPLDEISSQIAPKSDILTQLSIQEAAAQEKVDSTEGYLAQEKWIFGLIVAILVGFVIIGGIKSIASVTEKLVPFMCGIYVLAALVVIFSKAELIPSAVSTIFHDAFAPTAVAGGILGAIIQGVRRAAFSNEAGFGSAPIAHAAAKTKHAASEGLVALLEPFVDTVIVCTMTGLVIVITGMHEQSGLDGIALTSSAFSQVISWFPYILTASVVLFAFSTMISWSYYGQQAWAYLFGKSKVAEIIYKLIFCIFIVVGASTSLGNVLDFSDAMLFAMCLFNLIGVWLLFPVVKRELIAFQKHADEIDSKG
ncbi:MAG: alanine/glycine:cation symporter family protein [Akkermansiaceae bacterium]